jgi:nitroreductase
MLETVRARRSIRRYQPREIEPELLDQLEEAALRSPTSRNLKSWRFVFVTDRAKLVALSEAKVSFAQPLAGAALGIVVCGDDTVSDCWVEDCSIAATILQLTATSLGLGSCWIQMRGRSHADGLPAEEHVREILGLEPNLRVECVLSVGYPAEQKPPVPDEELAWDKLIELAGP